MGTNAEFLSDGITIPDLMILSELILLVKWMEPHRAKVSQTMGGC